MLGWPSMVEANFQIHRFLPWGRASPWDPQKFHKGASAALKLQLYKKLGVLSAYMHFFPPWGEGFQGFSK